MKYLVTGGAGFIGSNLCRRLLSNGDKVLCLDDLSTGKYHNIEELISNSNFVLLSVLISGTTPQSIFVKPSASRNSRNGKSTNSAISEYFSFWIISHAVKDESCISINKVLRPNISRNCKNVS